MLATPGPPDDLLATLVVRLQHALVWQSEETGAGEMIAALITEAGGTASVYGRSSGAGLALHAAHGLPIVKFVLSLLF
jgi:hypothetical protein